MTREGTDAAGSPAARWRIVRHRTEHAAASAPPGLWRSAGRATRSAVPVIVAAAALQTLLVAIPVYPGLTAPYLGLLAASLAVAAVALWLLAAIAIATVGGERMRVGPVPLGWSVLVVTVAAASAVLAAPVGAVVAVAGALVVVAVTARAGVRFTRHLAVWAIEALALVALVALVDLLLGFFVAGTAGAFLGNLAAGAAALIVTVAAARLVERA